MGRQTNKKVDFKEYVLNSVAEDFEIEKRLKEIAKDIKSDVNTKIKEMFDNSVKNSLSDAIFNVLATNETYNKITNQIKMLSD